jgi:hypothetical protein
VKRIDPRDEEGSLLPLTAFFGFLCLSLIFVVIAATSLALERERLVTLADGAALAGAEGYSLAGIRSSATGATPTLSTPDVAAAVDDYLAQAPHPGFESVQLDRAETVDGRSATVSLSAYWRPPVLTFLIPDGIRIEATTSARSVFS